MQSSRAQEIRAAGGVAAVALGQTATRIGQIHHAVAARSFAAVGPAGLPARLVQRSAGIKDLRFGAIVDEDWQGCDPDAWGPDPCSDIPPLETAAHYVIGATVSRDPSHRLGA